MKKAIIIGAGIGGLASAIRMAVKGYSVEVFEANSYPGGKLTEFHQKGFRFDAGPSLFTMPEKIDELFILAGKNPPEHFRYHRLDKICRYFFDDKTVLTAHADIEKFAKEANEKTGIPENRIYRHLKKSAFIYNSTAELFLNKSLHRLSTYFSVNTLISFLQIPFLNIFTSMNKANQKALQNGKTIQLFNRYATYNGSNPYQAPGILNIIPHLEFNQGAYFPQGGMQSITKSLFNLAEDLGVVFHFDERVDKIIIKKKQAQALVTSRHTNTCDLTICNMDVVPAYRLLMPDQKAPEKVLHQERSSSALIFYWGISKSFEQLLLHNIFFSKDYRKEFSMIFDHKTVSDDPTVYINITSKENNTDAPEGMENWFVMINVPANHNQDWDQLIAKARRNILTKVSGIIGEMVEPLIVSENILDPRIIENNTSSFQGALYGTASNTRMAAFFRHPNFSKNIKNLYFVGGSVHPGGGIPLALSSAKIVDQLIKPA